MLYIYNQSLALQGVITKYTSAKFKRELRGVGSLDIRLPCSEEYLKNEIDQTVSDFTGGVLSNTDDNGGLKFTELSASEVPWDALFWGVKWEEV